MDWDGIKLLELTHDEIDEKHRDRFPGLFFLSVVLNDIEIGNLFLTGDQEMVQSSEQIRKF
jgi:hypothetical protein